LIRKNDGIVTKIKQEEKEIGSIKWLKKNKILFARLGKEYFFVDARLWKPSCRRDYIKDDLSDVCFFNPLFLH
jgi:hypothetical protein